MDAERVLAHFAGKRVLLLQGPVGPFFCRLAAALRRNGTTVYKVNFNGGDRLFYRTGPTYRYRGTLAEWPRELERLLTELGIQAVIVFGDCRPIHMPAHDLAQRLGIEVWAFEEGYVRPNFVTLEPHGVNNRSRLPRDPAFYLTTGTPGVAPEREVRSAFRWAILWAMLYYAAAFLTAPWYRRRLHHRPLRMREGLPWLISPLRKWKYKFMERGVERWLSGLLSRRYFLVPLQVHVDAQVCIHSRFGTVPAFLETVIASFAVHARKTDFLAIKHHPLDRGYHDYSQLIRTLGRNYGLQDRLLYIHDQHLPTLLANARGVVLVNSTVGLSAVHHGTPLKVLGDALYDMPGLTAQCELHRFWHDAEQWRPDEALYRAFRAHVIAETQLNGSFYRPGLFDPRASPAELRTSAPTSTAPSERLLELQPDAAE